MVLGSKHLQRLDSIYNDCLIGLGCPLARQDTSIEEIDALFKKASESYMKGHLDNEKRAHGCLGYPWKSKSTIY